MTIGVPPPEFGGTLGVTGEPSTRLGEPSTRLGHRRLKPQDTAPARLGLAVAQKTSGGRWGRTAAVAVSCLKELGYGEFPGRFRFLEKKAVTLGMLKALLSQ